MKKNDFATQRQKPKEELFRTLQERRIKLQGLQYDLISGKIKSLKEIHMIQKDIAQLSTLLKSLEEKNTQ